MQLNGKTVGESLITVCEAGSTTRGDKNIAMKLADGAKAAGADAIKYILSNADELIAQPIDYEGQDLAEVIRGYTMDWRDWFEVVAHCKDIELPYFFSVGTIGYITLAESLENPVYKVSAWDSRNMFLIQAILDTGKPMIFDLSTVIPGEVCNILEYISERKTWAWLKDNVAFVYESHSPNLDEINLLSIPYLLERFGRPVGWSANGRDMCPDLWAVKNGACLVETRIRLDDSGGYHHEDKALNPQELAQWVGLMRNPGKIPWSFSDEEAAMGKWGLQPSAVDITSREKYYVSLVADKDISQGEVIAREMIAARRPGSGVNPIYQYHFVGKLANRDYKRNELLTYENTN